MKVRFARAAGGLDLPDPARPVVPSPVQRLPSPSNARPFVPGTPVAKATARGGVTAFGVSLQTVAAGPPSAMYRSPCESKAMPDGLQRAAADSE
jgi:hypothetical protein